MVIAEFIGEWAMPSIYSAQQRGEHTLYELDARYGFARTGFSDLEIVLNMARLDDRIEEAGIKPGDSIEVLVEEWVKSPEHQCMLLGLYWYPCVDAVFHSIDNNRVLVTDTRPGNESSRYAAFTDLESVLDFRKAL